MAVIDGPHFGSMVAGRATSPAVVVVVGVAPRDAARRRPAQRPRVDFLPLLWSGACGLVTSVAV